MSTKERKLWAKHQISQLTERARVRNANREQFDKAQKDFTRAVGTGKWKNAMQFYTDMAKFTVNIPAKQKIATDVISQLKYRDSLIDRGHHLLDLIPLQYEIDQRTLAYMRNTNTIFRRTADFQLRNCENFLNQWFIVDIEEYTDVITIRDDMAPTPQSIIYRLIYRFFHQQVLLSFGWVGGGKYGIDICPMTLVIEELGRISGIHKNFDIIRVDIRNPNFNLDAQKVEFATCNKKYLIVSIGYNILNITNNTQLGGHAVVLMFCRDDTTNKVYATIALDSNGESTNLVYYPDNDIIHGKNVFDCIITNIMSLQLPNFRKINEVRRIIMPQLTDNECLNTFAKIGWNLAVNDNVSTENIDKYFDSLNKNKSDNNKKKKLITPYEGHCTIVSAMMIHTLIFHIIKNGYNTMDAGILELVVDEHCFNFNIELNSEDPLNFVHLASWLALVNGDAVISTHTVINNNTQPIRAPEPALLQTGPVLYSISTRDVNIEIVRGDGSCLFYCLYGTLNTAVIRQKKTEIIAYVGDKLVGIGRNGNAEFTALFNFYFQTNRTRRIRHLFDNWRTDLMQINYWGTHFEITIFNKMTGIDVEVYKPGEEHYHNTNTGLLVRIYQTNNFIGINQPNMDPGVVRLRFKNNNHYDRITLR
jgi:hypothetical protein